MSYAIANIIYGIPLCANSSDAPFSKDLQALIDANDERGSGGFLQYYSGGSDETPRAFGIELGRFDEACAYTDPSTLQLTPTAEHEQKYQAFLAALSADEQALLATRGAPRVFFLWSTS